MMLQYMGFASFTVLIWDHIDTFEREVEHIWKSKKNLRGLRTFFPIGVQPFDDFSDNMLPHSECSENKNRSGKS